MIADLAGLHPLGLVAGLLAVGLGVVNRGAQARAAYRLMALPARLVPMVGLSATSYATNKLVRAGGTAGLVPFLADARARGHHRPAVVAAYLCITLSATAALCPCIFLAVGVGLSTGALHGGARVGAFASALYGAATIVTLGMLFARRCLVVQLATRIRRVAAIVRSTLRRPARQHAGAAGDDLLDVFDRLRGDPLAVVPLLATALAGKVIGALTLGAVLAGLGVDLPITTTFVVYTLTLMATMAGPLPAGIGTAEASLGALLVSYGVSAQHAATGVVAFRLLDVWLPIALAPAAALLRARRRTVPTVAVGDDNVVLLGDELGPAILWAA